MAPALPVRDFHLAGPATIGFHMQTRLGDERKMVELLTMASYMAGWSRFYHLSMQNLDEIVHSQERPSLVYYNLTMKCFGKAFGDSQPGRVKRISPSNIMYPAVYLDDEGNVTSKMDDVIDGVLGILKWIDETVGTDEFHHANIEKTFQACIAEVRNRSPMVLKRISTEFGMQDYGTDAPEGMLCETSVERVTKIFDDVMKGQYLFTLCTTTGNQLVKPYGSRDWQPVVGAVQSVMEAVRQRDWTEV